MILDCSYRLPGPLASHLLQNDGYEVLKIELSEKRDPFFMSRHNGVRSWYQRFNKGKPIKVFTEDDFKQFLEKYHKSIQGIIIDVRSPFLEVLKDYSLLNIVLSSSSDKISRPMHDLDILVRSGYFTDFETPIPEIPAAGILFANQIYSRFYKAKSEGENGRVDICLDQVTSILNLITLPKEDRFYRGVMVGYNKYKLKDGVLYLTAIEEKSFIEFISFIGLEERNKYDPTLPDSGSLGKLMRKSLDKMYVKDFSTYPKNRVCFSISETHHTE